jgi:hypothetical protein
MAGIALASAMILPMLSPMPAQAVTGGRWDKLNLSVSPPGDFPGIRSAFDSLRQEVVSVACCPTSTWVFNGASWTNTHATTPTPSQPYLNPAYVSLAWYPPTAKVVMVLSGGAVCPPVNQLCSDTWTWDGQVWTRQATPTQPYCVGTNLAFDAARNRLLAYGICPGDSVDATWSYDGTDWSLVEGGPGSPRGIDSPTGPFALAYYPPPKQLVLFGIGRGRYFGFEETWVFNGGGWDLAHSVSAEFKGGSIAWDGAELRLKPDPPPPNISGPYPDYVWNGSALAADVATGGPGLSSSAFDGDKLVVPLDGTWIWQSNSLAPRPWTGGHDVVGTPQPATDAYFAEGYTGLNFREYLTVFNPGAAQVLTARYLTDSGALITRTHDLAAQSRTTILVNSDLGADQSFSTHLTAPNPFVAERPMYFTLGGRSGGHDAMAAQSLGATFYFAEGYTGNGFDEYLTLMNSSASQTASVQVTYYFNGGAAPKSVAHPVSPTSRLTVHVNDSNEAGPNQQVSMKVTSDIPILAERPMYFNYFGQTGGHVVMGTTTPLTNLNLAEGHVGQSFNEYLTILNPNAAAASMTITYYRGSGPPVQQLVAVAANSRATVHVNDVLPSGTDSSVHIRSDQPVVVERPMYFTYNGWTGGHDAMAVPDTALGTSLSFAEGYAAANFAEYYTILNEQPADAIVTFTFYLASGTPVIKTITVPANSRWTEQINTDLPAGTSNSVQITSSQPILAERLEYFAY